MIQLHCPSGHAFRVAQEAAGIRTECPYCGREVLVPDPEQGVIPFDPANAPPPEELMPPEPAEPEPLTDEQPEDGSADRQLLRGLRLADLPDAIRQPTVGFGADVRRSPRVLFDGVNHLMLPVMAAVDLLILLGIAWVQFWGRETISALGVAVIFTPFAWHCAIFFRACEHACAGVDDAHLVGFRDGVWDDFFKPFGRFVSTWSLATTPLWGYRLLAAAVPGLPVTRELMLALIVVSLFLWPATVLLMVLADSVLELTPANLARIVLGAPGPYVLVWLTLAAVVALAAAAGKLLLAALGTYAASLIGVYLLLLLASAAGLVVMRIIGLLYRHFKAALPFDAE